MSLRLRPASRPPFLPWRGSPARAGATTVAPSTSPPLTFGSGSILDCRLYVAQGQDPNVDPDLWTWTEIPANYILWRDKVRISRGRAPGQTQANPSTMNLSLKNARGRFMWGLGTAMRFDVNPGTGQARRYTGFVVTKNPRSDTSGNDRWIALQCSGVLQRLGRNTAPAHSAVWSAIVRGTALAYPFSYAGLAASSPGVGFEAYGANQPLSFWWPLEDGKGSTTGASALLGGVDAATSGTVTFDSASPPAGITAAPSTAGGSISGTPTPGAVDRGTWLIAWYAQASGDCVLARWTTVSPVRTWEYRIESGVSQLYVDGVNSGATASAATVADSAWHSYAVVADVVQAPGATVYSVSVDADFETSSGSFTTLGVISSVTMNPAGSANCVAVSQVSGGPVGPFPTGYDIGNPTGVDGLGQASAGYPGEDAIMRFFRIVATESIPVEVRGDSGVIDGTVVAGALGYADANGKRSTGGGMGPQGTQAALSIFRECEATNDGVLVERLSGRLGFDRHDERENRAANLTVRVGQGGNAQLLPPMDANVDDQRIINDVTVTTTTGSAGRDVETLLARGVPRAGRYPTSLNLNALDANDARQHASYEAMRGTADEPRFDVVTFNLAKSPELIAAWLACDIGSRVVVQNLDETIWLQDLGQLIEGYTEEIDQNNWIVTPTLSTDAPYRAFVVGSDDENLGRIDNPGSKLVGALTDDASITSIQVSSPGALWRTGPAGWPLALAGEPAERVEVVSISGASSPQTFTITRHSGQTVPHLDGAAANLWRPGVLALHPRR